MSGSVRVVEEDRNNPIVVTAQGMVSSLGLDAATSCAAARAGLRRAQALDYLRFASLDGRSVEAAVGHPVPIITHGFEGAPRLAQLAAAAVRDLSNGLSVAHRSNVSLYLSLPSCRRHLSGAELVADAALRDAFLDNACDPSFSADDESWSAAVLSSAVPAIGLSDDDRSILVSHSGHTGFSEALAAAVQDLNTGTIDLAIVGAVDSLTDEQSLGWLKITGRLKNEANPTGVEPGEAGVFFAVERQHSAAKRKAAPLSRIGTIVFEDDQCSRLSGSQPTGRALAECIRSALAEADDLWLVSDLNGESGRGIEFGRSLTRVLSRPEKQLLPPLYPAASFGDTGAASGGVATSLVQTSFCRGYATAEIAIVASVGDDIQRSAFSLRRMGS